MTEISAPRGRWAVAAMFLVNGFLTGSWAPQIPVFLSRLEISEFTLGLLILVFGLGAAIHRFRKKAVAQGSVGLLSQGGEERKLGARER